MASNAQKLSAASEFIADAPPGEMNEVLAGKYSSFFMFVDGDLRTILEKNSDHEFVPSLEKYNMEQFINFKSDESDRRVPVLLERS